MKKLFFLLTAVLLTLGACKKDNETTPKQLENDDFKIIELGVDSETGLRNYEISIKQYNNLRIGIVTEDDTSSATVIGQRIHKMLNDFYGNKELEKYIGEVTVRLEDFEIIDTMYITPSTLTSKMINNNSPITYYMSIHEEWDNDKEDFYSLRYALSLYTTSKYDFIDFDEPNSAYITNGYRGTVNKNSLFFEIFLLYNENHTFLSKNGPSVIRRKTVDDINISLRYKW